jgi:hypothetical protein
VKRRRGRAGQAGAETLELVAILPLLGLVFLVAWQGVVLVRQQIEAQSDARELARRAALCARAAPTATLADVDPPARGAALTTGMTGRTQVIRVEVRLVPQTVLPGLVLDTRSPLAPRAVVVMRREPC